jgi:hypothetical protein
MLNPNAKAMELFDKFSYELGSSCENTTIKFELDLTKRLCLMSVNEIIESRKDDKRFDNTSLQHSEYYSLHPCYLSYWLEVIKKINIIHSIQYLSVKSIDKK